MTEERIGYLLGFRTVPGIGIVRMRRLIDAFGDARSAWHASVGELIAAGVQPRAAEAIVTARRRFDPAAELARLEKAGIVAVAWDDAGYPGRLAEIPAAPPVLFVRGTLPDLAAPWLAIVGTRHATAYGRAMTERLARDLAASGVVIVSGFARGVDTWAHRAALAAGGATVAVFACGLDVIYPPENRALAIDIVATGACVSEHMLAVKPEATNFPARNRLISGLCQATLVVEAGERSGALITSAFAADQGRDVMAVPGPATSPRSVGTNRLIQDGARLVVDASDVLSELGIDDRHPRQLGLDGQSVDDGLGVALLAALDDGPARADELARQLVRPVAEVASRLTTLEIDGYVRQVAGLNFRARR
ncbi:MAG: DNA-protecting protein DprA [Chloroflexota bacterium]|nr:MAG: DNA-protecting protein DprA [Chloroflexota bacterium]